LNAQISLGPLWRGSAPQTIGNDGLDPNFGVSSLEARSSDIAAAIWFCFWALAGQVSSTPGCIMTIWMRFPLGECNLPCFGVFSVQLYFCLQPVPQTRYLANDGQAIVVRPTGNPAGTRVYEMKWQKHQSLQPVGWILHHRLARSMDRTQGDRSGGPEMCQIFLGDRERKGDVNRSNQQVGLKDCVFGCPLEGLLSSGVSTIQSFV
jgi:hypothetical protein